MSKPRARRRTRDLALGLALLLATLGLMLFPQQTMSAARDGLTLCGNVIIPSLFPFFVLSSLVVELGLAGCLGRALEGIMRPLFRVGGACAPAFALGFIGGYPVGARTAINLYENGMCSKTEAERLLAFCNNSGPAFILGVVGAGIFASSAVGVLLYLVHAAASICVGLIFRFYRAGREGGTAGQEVRPAPRFEAKGLASAFTGSIKGAFLSTLNICAFVVFFTVAIRLLALTGVLPGTAKLLGLLFGPFGMTQAWAERLLTGVLEISSGVWTLSGATGAVGRLPMAAFMLGWAGCSVHCQVLSFMEDSGLSARPYLIGKLLHGGFSALLTAVLVRILPLRISVASYLTDQADTLAGLDFHTALTFSLLSACGIFLLFLFAAAATARKKIRR